MSLLDLGFFICLCLVGTWEVILTMCFCIFENLVYSSAGPQGFLNGAGLSIYISSDCRSPNLLSFDWKSHGHISYLELGSHAVASLFLSWFRDLSVSSCQPRMGWFSDCCIYSKTYISLPTWHHFLGASIVNIIANSPWQPSCRLASLFLPNCQCHRLDRSISHLSVLQQLLKKHWSCITFLMRLSEAPYSFMF